MFDDDNKYPSGTMWFSDLKSELKKHVLYEDDGILSEGDAEILIYDFLCDTFMTKRIHRQYNLEGYWGFKIDIDVVNKWGVEIKLAKSLSNASEVQRMLGQLTYYQYIKYEELIICVVGEPTLMEQRYMIELRDIVESMGITFIYIPILCDY